MAKMSAAAKAPMPADDDDEDATGADAGGADAGEEGDEDEDEDEGEGDDDDKGDVLLTVMKESDGTYRLIEGDEDEEGEGGEGEGAEAGGAGAAAGGGDEEQGKTYDSIGALLKGVLDILQEDKSSASGEGSSDDQFSAGFNENSPPKAAAPMAQKY